MRALGSTSPLHVSPWTLRIIAANGVVHLLAITVLGGTAVLNNLAFVPNAVLSRPWTALTYMFLHGGLMHLAFNMLVLFFFGSAVEEKMGSGRYVRYYVFCGLGGAALSFVFASGTPIIGASAAVYGVALAFASYWPNAEVYVFPIPFPVKTKWIVGFLLASSLLFALLGSSDGIAHFAHLGGFLFGGVYLAYQRGLFSRFKVQRRKSDPVIHYPTTPQRRSNKNRPHDPSIYDEVDKVLDKISSSGIDSLTAKEKRILEESSKQMRHN